MIFKEGQAIFIQIAERICDEILAGKYEADARIPGVRDYSVTLEVNVNTTVKAYEQLAQRGVIYNKRGLGYFVAADAQSQILKTRRETFFNSELPELVCAYASAWCDARRHQNGLREGQCVMAGGWIPL